MENDKVDLISKDLEFVKDTVQETGRRISSLESSMSDFHKDFSSISPQTARWATRSPISEKRLKRIQNL